MTYFTHICLALRSVHAKGVVHYDIKVENVILKQEGGKLICLLSDFGISKVIGTLTDLTKTARGTIFTMSPEVIRREPHDQSADVFSLGCVLYEMCALERAFVSDSREKIEHMVLNSNPPRIPR